MSGTEQSKKKNIKRVIWSAAEESMLLDLWQEKIDDLRGARKNSHIFQKIAAKLEETGFCGSSGDVRTKVDNLTRKYRHEKAKVGTTGGTPSTWEHYHKINNILGSFRLHNIQEAMHESTDMSTLLEESESVIEFDPVTVDLNESSSSGWNVTETEDSQWIHPKKRKRDVNAEMLKLARDRNEFQRQVHQERKQQINEMLKRLDTISEQQASFQSELLSILRDKN